MKRLALLTALASCQAPDRWHTSIARGNGDIDGMGWHDFEQETTTLEVGVSGDLGFKKPEPLPPPIYREVPAPTPTDDSGLPLTELLYIVIGAGAWKGQEVARAKYRQRRAS